MAGRPRKQQVKKTTKTNPRTRRARVSKETAQTKTQTSYVSLLYGILTVIVVFVFALLALNFFANRHSSQLKGKGQITDKAASTSNIKVPTGAISPKLSGAPTSVVVAVSSHPTTSPVPSVASSQQKSKPTPTTYVSPTPLQKPIFAGKTYTVHAGDDLWGIAEKVYGSGYNWKDIAQANNLADPSVIHSGNVLKIPQLSQNQIAQRTVVPSSTPELTYSTASISAQTYVVQKGDYLAEIAQRAYGDANRWPDIAKANNLTDPSLIFSGNELTIPR